MITAQNEGKRRQIVSRVLTWFPCSAEQECVSRRRDGVAHLPQKPEHDSIVRKGFPSFFVGYTVPRVLSTASFRRSPLPFPAFSHLSLADSAGL